MQRRVQTPRHGSGGRPISNTPHLQVQAFASLAMVLVLFIFVCATFRAPLPRPLPVELRASNFAGLSSIAVMPISLVSATIYSEAMWQRCWATASRKCARCLLPKWLSIAWNPPNLVVIFPYQKEIH